MKLYNRRNFFKFLAKGAAIIGAAGVLGLPGVEDNLDDKRTIGGWINRDDIWSYNIIHTTNPKYWFDNLFDAVPSALVFVSNRLTDDEVKSLYYKTKPFFGDKVDESIEAYL